LGSFARARAGLALTPEPSHPFGRALSRPIQKLFGQNVVLFFPSDRSELPDWLNEQALAEELRFLACSGCPQGKPLCSSVRSPIRE
jgi:hypothetical protein